ncbi:MAG: iron dicitrate transport regulator FecR [Bacteroidetes bacterium]|jgi:transmembrane sensor|nr:iron dicitrate transport regulator FecR [Bacteroidota bacterium]
MIKIKEGNVYDDASVIRRHLLEEVDATETDRLQDLFEENPELRKVYEELQKREVVKDALSDYKRYSSKQAYKRFLAHIGCNEKLLKRPIDLIWRWHTVAAVFVLVAGISFWLTNSYRVNEKTSPTVACVAPGVAKADILLPDGRVINVGKKNLNLSVNGVQVSYKSGVLSYQDTVANTSSRQMADDLVAESNKLIIPRGGENTVILSDGTVVHLNAGSKLTYPVKFIQKQRMVALEGEGYFEVAHDENRKFIVQTRYGNITVYGTAFNVHAYKGEQVYATLVRGKISFTNGTKELFLNPGEQAIVSAEGMEKKTVDVEEYVGWATGKYTFNNKTLKEIMDIFSRWYDVHVYYEEEALENISYTGNVKRYDNINAFLDALVLTGDLTYKVNGKNILIYRE